ncbi:HypC/HybG/HupF family hydrogenase formation chaperone [Candidatus Thiothrix sp. Deng01]|uniref:HypC/HybG/HupF family hydrogenase formation chaperone n=1 Tax=Candidatus Thiothrix phosphatis TaxID=3112415 RepID=A0ABU6CUS4_9GAMM|nr:HypC/HybG/HupF family hydrogenase formation chaperone [Candidatus Thiothrix sp. Deng01]MEB4590267.1 HypC/HybG/HupF family hydrogenase formation chaperone [Candidatus Thiothrix sp. Deng01]
MCIGIPMQIMAIDGWMALCGEKEHRENVDISLLGSLQEGDWVLVYKGAAREHLPAERAKQILQAVQALAAIREGQGFEHFFADLIEREPQLPEHLRTPK